MKKFAVFDIDGTLFRWQLFHELVFELIERGHIPKNAKLAIDQKMNEWRDRTHHHAFSDYEMAVVNAFVPHVKGLKVRDVETAAETILQRSGSRVYTYTRNLIEDLRRQGYVLIAISGSQNEIVQRFAKLWKFDFALGQIHDIVGDSYTETIPGGTLLIHQKGKLLKQVIKDNDLSWEDSIAVGDSLSDASMLELVEQPIAFNPNDQLFEIAKKHGWKVVIERKNMIYQLEYRDGQYILAQANS